MTAFITLAYLEVVRFSPRYVTPGGLKAVLIILLPIGIIGLFGALYFRDWWINRGFRKYCLDRQRDAVADLKPLQVTDGERKPLVTVPRVDPLFDNRGRTSTGAAAGASPGPHGTWLSSTGTHPAANGAREESRSGILHIEAQDAGCEVFVDGGFCGNVPAKLKLPEGLHVVELKSAGTKQYRREIQIVDGAELSLRQTS